MPNPQRLRLDRAIAAKRKALAKLKAELGDVLLDEPRDGSHTGHGLKIAQKGAVRQLRGLEGDIAALIAERKPLPTHVTVAELDQPREVMQLEHKHRRPHQDLRLQRRSLAPRPARRVLPQPPRRA